MFPDKKCCYDDRDGIVIHIEATQPVKILFSCNKVSRDAESVQMYRGNIVDNVRPEGETKIKGSVISFSVVFSFWNCLL